MKVFGKQLILVVSLALSFLASAETVEPQAFKTKFESLLGWSVSSIADAPIEGLLQLNTERGIFYASEDGKYLLQARIFNMDEGMRNETEEALTAIRMDGMGKFDGQAVEFKAENEKFVVSVFTDITCGYCRKLHEQIGDYNDAGITVRYLAFPRAGLEGESYNNMVSVWCAKDPQVAMTKAKSGDGVVAAKCENTVAEQFKFGQQIGVNGTPNIILPNGGMIPGYQPPSQLLEILQNAAS